MERLDKDFFRALLWDNGFRLLTALESMDKAHRSNINRRTLCALC